MPHVNPDIAFSLIPLALLLFALYWVVRLGVAAGIRSVMPDVVKATSRTDRA